jgi:hypothetical protein
MALAAEIFLILLVGVPTATPIKGVDMKIFGKFGPYQIHPIDAAQIAMEEDDDLVPRAVFHVI